MGKGIVGVVTKPVAGTVSLASQTLKGIANTPGFILEEQKTVAHVFRLPRYRPSATSALTPYNEADAFGYALFVSLLSSADRKKERLTNLSGEENQLSDFPYNESRAHRPPLVNDGRAVIPLSPLGGGSFASGLQDGGAVRERYALTLDIPASESSGAQRVVLTSHRLLFVDPRMASPASYLCLPAEDYGKLVKQEVTWGDVTGIAEGVRDEWADERGEKSLPYIVVRNSNILLCSVSPVSCLCYG